MSKNASKAAAPTSETAIAPAAAPTTAAATLHTEAPSLEAFKKVDLQRVWYKSEAGQKPVFFLVLARSDDMREAFKSRYPDDLTPKYVYACETTHAVKATDRVLFRGDEAIDAEPGTLFFMFGKTSFSELLALSKKRKEPVYLQAIAKREIQSRTRGSVMAWQFEAGRVNGYAMTSRTKPSDVILPDGADAVFEAPADEE